MERPLIKHPAALLLAVVTLPLQLSLAAPPSTRPVTGLRDNTPEVFALTGARIVVAPGRVIPQGNVVVRDGVITAVGPRLAIPADARVFDLTGRTIYAGLLDAYHEFSLPTLDKETGAPYWNELITPERNVAEHFAGEEGSNEKLRSQGITAQLVAPSSGIIKGESAVVLTGTASNHASILAGKTALHVRLTVARRRSSYPNSPMGAVALARQAFYDADWYRAAWNTYRSSSTLPRPERNDALAALQPYCNDGGLIIADAANELYFLRADEIARELGLKLVVRGSGHEYRQIDAIRQTGRSVLVPIDFPKPPNVATAEAAQGVTLEQLMHWDLAPENPARLEAAGVKFALTSAGLDDRGAFLKQLRRAVERGLTTAAALRSVTTAPAEILQMDHLVGTVESGKLANLVVTDGDLFDNKTKVLETWVAGERHEVESRPTRDLRGTWQVRLLDDSPSLFSLRLTGEPDRLKGKIVVGEAEADAKSEPLEHIGFRDGRMSGVFDGGPFDRDGKARLTAIVSNDGSELQWLGHIVWPDGSRSELTGVRPSPSGEETSAGQEDDSTATAQDDEPTNEQASFEVNFPMGAFGVEAAPGQPDAVMFNNATIWTCGPAGVLENASLLIKDGRVVAVGKELDVPPGATVIDATGKHLSPGIIDCHSHMATDGGVNESGQAITAEVRIGDFINSDDIAIYRQLAGGVTTSNLLHGSANPIGGQNQVIKLRWGSLPAAMKFAGAPAGIKFALGENVTRSNRREPSNRYPRSRMGVEQIMRDAFHAARDYQIRREDWQKTRQGLPPRRDLELDALAEILAGERWVHCHSYRQDEILALIRTLNDFGVQIGTFQHILEGYKVADEMAKQGAMGSAFSDWWAYKFEVYDAIPYAGALMHRAGVVVSFNSDDRELARHLNHDAAKAVKYGGVPPAEALKFVTLNPARQLRIDQQVGSLEPQKDADVVVWSGDPLSIFSRCEQTWIDGRKYFDIAADRIARQEAAQRHNQLVQKILSSGESMRSSEDESEDKDELQWAREDVYCRCRNLNALAP